MTNSKEAVDILNNSAGLRTKINDVMMTLKMRSST